MSDEALKLSHAARILPKTLDSLRQTEEGRAAIEAVGEDSIFTFSAEISNTLLDSHFTRMSERTLKNYAEDATTGVSFLLGHNRYVPPTGYSVQGHLIEGQRKSVIADFYTVRGLPDSDDLITRIQTSLLRDVSVGFFGGEVTCDICHEDFWNCRHYPGMKYEIKEDGRITKVVATFEVDNARLSEVSGVFDGSTPEAMILKAQRHASAGLLDQKQIDLLEQTYRTRLPTKRSFAVPQERKSSMEDKDLERVREILGVSEDSEIIQATERLHKRIKDLEPLAEEGKQYRKDEVARALAEGVRVYGNDFDKDKYQSLLENAPLDMVQRLASDWKKTADGLLPIGRVTTEKGDEPPKPEKAHRYPDEAYA